jgi:hypothetical protein
MHSSTLVFALASTDRETTDAARSHISDALCRSHRTDGCTGMNGLGHVLYRHVPTWLTRAPGLLISSLRVPDAYGPTSSIPILALFASPSPFVSRVYSTALPP